MADIRIWFGLKIFFIFKKYHNFLGAQITDSRTGLKAVLSRNALFLLEHKLPVAHAGDQSQSTHDGEQA